MTCRRLIQTLQLVSRLRVRGQGPNLLQLEPRSEELLRRQLPVDVLCLVRSSEVGGSGRVRVWGPVWVLFHRAAFHLLQLWHSLLPYMCQVLHQCDRYSRVCFKYFIYERHPAVISWFLNFSRSGIISKSEIILRSRIIQGQGSFQG